MTWRFCLRGILIGAAGSVLGTVFVSPYAYAGPIVIGLLWLWGGGIGFALGLVGRSFRLQLALGPRLLLGRLAAWSFTGSLGGAVALAVIFYVPPLHFVPWTILGIGISIGAWLCDRSFQGLRLLLAGGLVGGLLADGFCAGFWAVQPRLRLTHGEWGFWVGEALILIGACPAVVGASLGLATVLRQRGPRSGWIKFIDGSDAGKLVVLDESDTKLCVAPSKCGHSSESAIEYWARITRNRDGDYFIAPAARTAMEVGLNGPSISGTQRLADGDLISYSMGTVRFHDPRGTWLRAAGRPARTSSEISAQSPSQSAPTASKAVNSPPVRPTAPAPAPTASKTVASPPAHPPAPAPLAMAPAPSAGIKAEKTTRPHSVCPSCGQSLPSLPAYCIVCDQYVESTAPKRPKPKPVSVEDAKRVLREETTEVTAEGDVVDCTVFSPTEVRNGEEFLVQVFAHKPEKAKAAQARATEFDKTTRRGGFTSLLATIKPGSKLHFHLAMRKPHFNGTRELVWRGRTEPVQFVVEVGADQKPRTAHGTVTVTQDGVPLGQISFPVTIISANSQATQASAPTGTAHPFERFFISYAATDRPVVIMRVQMLERLGKTFFQDILHIDPGERWERRLYQEIDRCDAVLLFWSSNAKQSEWVMKECRYAIEKKGIDRLLPVIIEGPPPVPPPPELSELQFNDQLLYFMKG